MKSKYNFLYNGLYIHDTYIENPCTIVCFVFYLKSDRFYKISTRIQSLRNWCLFQCQNYNNYTLFVFVFISSLAVVIIYSCNIIKFYGWYNQKWCCWMKFCMKKQNPAGIFSRSLFSSSHFMKGDPSLSSTSYSVSTMPVSIISLLLFP